MVTCAEKGGKWNLQCPTKDLIRELLDDENSRTGPDDRAWML